jgi:hypothetical protein
MVRRIVILVAVLSCNLTTQAQDLIVTTGGDSLECHITHIMHNMVHITLLNDSVESKAVLPRNMIAHYAVDYKNEWEEPTPVDNILNPPRFRASIGIGLSNLIGKTSENVPADFIPYTEELKSGNHLGADVTYYVNKRIGFGLKYIFFNTKNQLNNIYVIDSSGTVTYGSMEDNITMQFIGPSLGIRQTLPRGGAHLVSNLALGIITYVDDARVIEKLRITGSTFGFSGDLGLDFQLEGGFYLGIGFGLTVGMIRALEVEQGGVVQKIDLNYSSYNNVSRIDLGIGLRYFMQ